tara:strand:+ start:988 stop:1305 length:318 start_codon:yes stop_codon:yes gene_type:complete
MFTRRRRNTQVECADGFTMSVQAFDGAYCSPREDDAPRYSEVEIGYPSEADSFLIPYAENPDTPTDTVYAYVPVETVFLVISKHGGMVSGEVPPGVPEYRTEKSF